MFSGKYIIVTGGAGFIGSGVLRALNDQGVNRLVVVDNLGSSEKWKNLLGKRFLEVLHKEALFKWLEGRAQEIEAIIHLGACSTTLETDANYLLENNYRFSVRLAEYALHAGCRFIYASSAATYGKGDLGFSDDHEQLDNYRPLNMYGYSKHLFDLWLKNQNVLNKMVGLKYFNVFGPNEYHKGRMASAILKMVSDAHSSGIISLFKSSEPERFKDGCQVRDFIYVKDAARITAHFLENEICGIFNVGTGHEQTWQQLAEAVIHALDKAVTIRYIEMPKELIGKYQNYTCAEMKKTQQHHLMQPQFSLQEAVTDYVRHYLLPGEYW